MDVEANSSIYFGNLSNKYIKLDIPLTISSLNGTVISNSTIELLAEASGSTLRNLIFYSQCDSENSNYSSPIYISEANDLVIEDNLISIDYYEGCNYNLAGIYAFGSSNNNLIRNNRISIYKSGDFSSKHYIYGIDFSTFSSNRFATGNAYGNIISSNIIDIVSDYYANAITLSCAEDTLIDSNKVYLKSDSFVYGLVAEYFDSGYGMARSNNFTFSGNSIEASSNMVYAIQFFGVIDVRIRNNSIKTTSNGTYGISAYESFNHDIENNRIIISGEDISQVGTNFDAIGSGHSGIYYMKDSYNISIHDNNVLSNYSLGGDYAIKFDAGSTENITIFNNNLSSNNANYLGNDAVSGYVTVYDNNPFIDLEGSPLLIDNFTLIDIFVSLNGSDVSGDGSSDNPFLSLNKALNHLETLNDNQDSNSNSRIKGIIHLGEGIYNTYPNSLRLIISDLDVDIIGVYNKTIIDGKGSHWFFEISDGSSVSIKNISFYNGTYRKNDVGLIYNKANLNIENCSFTDSKLPASSAIIYNDGNLTLKNSFLELNSNSYLIYNNGILKLNDNRLNGFNKSKIIFNNGFIDNLFLNLIVDSLNEDERVLNINSTKLNLTAFVHDDNGNPVSGGFVKFFIEGREILVNTSLNDGVAILDTYSSLHGLVKVSGFYSNAYTNLNVNIGRIHNELISDFIVLYVSSNSNDGSSNYNDESSSLNNEDSDDNLVDLSGSYGDGSLEHPFTSVNKALIEIGNKTIEPVTIYLLDEIITEEINSSYIGGTSQITIRGNENKTNVKCFWVLNTTTPILLKDLVFDGYFLLKIGSDLTVDNCLFTHAPQSSIFSFNGSLTILNSNFTQNNIKDPHYSYMSYKSGSIPSYLTLFLDESFVGNYYEKGGSICNLLSNLTILNSNFIENEAFYGGAIFNGMSDLHISNSNFISNLAIPGIGIQDFYGYSKGGAIFQYLGEEVVITDSLFINNTADNLGGAFFSSGIYPNFNVLESEILGVYGISRETEDGFVNSIGKVVENIISPQDIYFINCTFDSNLAPKGGGAVYTVNNSFTSYISCNFLNNMAFSYNMSQLFEGYSYAGGNYIYQDELENIFSVIYSSANYGGAIHDNNLKIIDSTFTANTVESGGSIILPTILTYTAERNSLPKSNGGITISDSVSGGESVYVADSSLLTAGDSAYLGINGWSGSSNGSSIVRIIKDNPSSSGYGNGSGSDVGNGNGSGIGTGNGGFLNWGDILSALGGDSNNIAINGDGSGLVDYLNNLINGKSNSSSSSNSSASSNSRISNETSSDSSSTGSSNSNSTNSNAENFTENFPVNSTSDVTNGSSNSVDSNLNNTNSSNVEEDVIANTTQNIEDMDDSEIDSDGVLVIDDETYSTVGETSDPLSEESSNADSSSSSEGSSSSSSSSSPGSSSSSPASSSSNAYELMKEDIDDGIIQKDIELTELTLFVFFFLLLVILGYYIESRNDEG